MRWCAPAIDINVPTSLRTTYAYHPATDTSTRLADMPYDNWAMACGGATGKLQVAGGSSSLFAVNRAAEYDPVSETWSALPNANNTFYRPGSSCGLYQIGGAAEGECGPVSYTLKTDASGYYQVWLDKGYNPLHITAAMNGYQPQFQIVQIRKGADTSADFALPRI